MRHKLVTDNPTTPPLESLSQDQAENIVEQHEKLYSAVLGGARADFSFYDLTGINFVNRVLSDADFTGACLRDADFSGAQLERACFFGADVRQADMGGANLRRADLRGACLRGANLAGADLYQADLRGGTIAKVSKPGSIEYLSHGDVAQPGLPPTQFDEPDAQKALLADTIACQADLSDAVMRGCNLTGANLKSARLDDAILENANLSGADLSGASLRGTVLVGANMTQTRLSQVDTQTIITDAPAGTSLDELDAPLEEILEAHDRWVRSGGAIGQPADLSGVDLRGKDMLSRFNLTALKAVDAVCYGLSLGGIALQGAKLMGADLRSVDFSGADLRGTNFAGARLNNANMRGCDLGALLLSDGQRLIARLNGACLRFANLADSRIEGAVFDSADLSGANLVGAKIGKATFHGAIVHEAKFPDRYVPTSEAPIATDVGAKPSAA